MFKTVRLAGFLVALLLLTSLAGRPALADGWCKLAAPPSVNIHTSTDQVAFDFTNSEKQLDTFPVDTINPYGKSVITDVGGLMKGGIVTQQKMQFSTLTNTQTNEICYFYSTVDVSIHIHPTIYIASKYPPGTCMHDAIMNHELKHVTVDRDMVNKYAQLIGQAVKAEVDARPVYGPAPVAQSKAVEEQLKSALSQVVLGYVGQMDAERKQRQQAVDNLQEYQRVNHSCGDRK